MSRVADLAPDITLLANEFSDELVHQITILRLSFDHYVTSEMSSSYVFSSASHDVSYLTFADRLAPILGTVASSRNSEENVWSRPSPP